MTAGPPARLADLSQHKAHEPLGADRIVYISMSPIIVCSREAIEATIPRANVSLSASNPSTVAIGTSTTRVATSAIASTG